MRFVLKSRDGDGYYAGECRDRYDLPMEKIVDNLEDALVFTMTTIGRDITVSPELPYVGTNNSSWIPVAIKISLETI